MYLFTFQYKKHIVQLWLHLVFHPLKVDFRDFFSKHETFQTVSDHWMIDIALVPKIKLPAGDGCIS